MATIPYDERLDGLLSKAAQVFADHGYHGTTMRDLARATGMSLAGIYHYVSGKDELLFLIQERCFSRVLEGAEMAVPVAGTPCERLERFIRHHVTFFARHMGEMKVLSHEAESLSAGRVAGVNDLKRRYVEMLLDLIRAVRRDTAITTDPKVLAYALFGMMNWIYNWYDPEGPVSPDDLADQFSQLYLHGLIGTPAMASHGS